MATRTHAREMVVELLYAYAMGNERIFDFADELLGAKKIRNAQADFAKGLFNGVVAHLQNIDSIIEANLKSWEISRLGVIDKCILRLGVYEILKGEIDAPVAINEAIEIAKILGAENTGRFVNGVLDAIRKKGLDLNSSLGASCGDFGNLGRFADFHPVSHSKFPKNSTTSTANTRIVKSNNESAESSLQKFKPHPKSLPQGEGLAFDSPSLARGDSKDSPSLAEGARGWVKTPSLRESRSDSKQSKKNKSARNKESQKKLSFNIKRSKAKYLKDRDSSLRGRSAQNDNLRESAESRLDSANQNNSSLRADSQNLRGKPPYKKTQNLQRGLPRFAKGKSLNDNIKSVKSAQKRNTK